MFGMAFCGVSMCTTVMYNAMLKWYLKEAFLKVKSVATSQDWPFRVVSVPEC